MIQLMKLKDLVLQFFGRYEIYVMAAIRFVIGFVAFRLIIQNTGYFSVLSDYPIAILAALLCCFLPAGVMVFVAAVLILLEFYYLSPMICMLVGVVFLIMFCLYLRFTTRKGLYVILTPILSVLGVPYTMPVASGLLGEPYAVIACICGEVTYFFMRTLTVSSALFVVSDETDSTATSVLSLAVTELFMDREMYLYLAGFAAAAIVTFCFRRLKVNQSHLIAAAMGIVSQIAIIGGGEVFMGNPASLTRILVGCAVSFLILMIISFFTHNLDYKRVENVQFEDDDYYYYVRAIPKSFRQPKDWKVTVIDKTESPAVSVEEVSEEISGAPVSRKKNRKKSARNANEIKPQENEPEKIDQTEGTSTTQLAEDAASQAAAAEAAERAAAEAVAERAAAAAQAISAAAGQKETKAEETKAEETKIEETKTEETKIEEGE